MTVEPFNYNLLEDKDFLDANKITFDTISNIEDTLRFMGDIYTIAYINMHTIFLKTFGNQKNSNLILVPKGFGKTTFLKAIVNTEKKITTELPEKMYESFLSKEQKDYFHKKILIHYDLIPAITGLSQKQRDQLVTFWSSLLSDGRFHRHNQQPLNNVECLVMFGMAKETYFVHRKMLEETTFLDRVTPIQIDLSQRQKKMINKLRTAIEKQDLKIKLIRNKSKNIEYNRVKFFDIINPYAMQLDEFKVMASTRAMDYISNFLIANAYINNRKKVSIHDINMYKYFHHYHINQHDLTTYHKVAQILAKNPSLHISEVAELTNKNRKTIAKHYYQVKRSMKPDIDEAELDPHFDYATLQQVVKIYQDDPTIPFKEAAKQMNTYSRKVSRYYQYAIETGLLE